MSIYWKGSEMAFASDCVQHLSSSLSHFWHYLSIYTRLFPAVWEVGERETGACAASARDSEKLEMEKVSQLINHIKWLRWIMNGKFIANMCTVTREEAVGRAPSCRVQAMHIIWPNGRIRLTDWGLAPIFFIAEGKIHADGRRNKWVHQSETAEWR